MSSNRMQLSVPLSYYHLYLCPTIPLNHYKNNNTAKMMMKFNVSFADKGRERRQGNKIVNRIREKCGDLKRFGGDREKLGRERESEKKILVAEERLRRNGGRFESVRGYDLTDPKLFPCTSEDLRFYGKRKPSKDRDAVNPYVAIGCDDAFEKKRGAGDSAHRIEKGKRIKGEGCEMKFVTNISSSYNNRVHPAIPRRISTSPPSSVTFAFSPTESTFSTDSIFSNNNKPTSSISSYSHRVISTEVEVVTVEPLTIDRCSRFSLPTALRGKSISIIGKDNIEMRRKSKTLSLVIEALML